jgi:YVTN family beta-propeller protein
MAVGDRPVGVAVSPDGQLVVVAELGEDRVRLLEGSDLRTRTIVSVADRPHGLAFSPNGRHLLVSHLLSGKVTVLTFRPFVLYFPFLSGSTLLSGLGRGMRSLSSHEPTVTTIATWPNVAPAPSVIVNGSGTRAYLAQTMANGRGLNTAFDTTVFPKVSVLDLTAGTHLTGEQVALPERDQPVGLPWDAALAKGDDELWVVHASSNDLSVLDIRDPSRPSRVAHLTVGDNPRGIVLHPAGHAVYVNNVLAGTVSVIDAETYAVTEVVTTTELPLPPTLLHGKRLYHSSARPDLALAKWISCNTCHVEGEHDGRTWLLQYTGEVPVGAAPIITRNTTSLLGMIETYPLRWSAEWDESADSEFSIRTEQFGLGLIEGQMHPTLGAPNAGRSYDLDCLAAFIDSLVVPARTHTLTPAEARGKGTFESAETDCLRCHPPPLYTDLKQHDVGTADAPGEWFGPAIDTPTLRFLYDSASYLHDGSAATLHAVLTTANPKDTHGVTSDLTAQEIDDLVAFLRALPYTE